MDCRSRGVHQGDRIAIVSENRPEWSIADFAILLLGAVTVPVYATLTPEQTAFTLRDSGATAVFVSTEQQLRKVQTILAQTQVNKIVVMDRLQIPAELAAQCKLMDRFMTQGPVALDPKTEAAARSIQPDDLATIIYTSGTTGISKGAMLTHGNMASNINYSMLGFDVHPGLTSISFLPLSHVTARHVDLAFLYHGVTLAYCPFIENLPETLLEVRPTLCVSVPRVYEKIYAKTETTARGFPKRSIYNWALSVGRAHKPEILAGEIPTSATWKLANKLVFSKIRAGMGGNVETFISGGAPLGRELAEWYASMGIRIHEGYGLTETSPVIAVNTLSIIASAQSERYCPTSKSASPRMEKFWCAALLFLKDIGIALRSRRMHFKTAGSKLETSATSMPMDIFRLLIARKSSSRPLAENSSRRNRSRIP